MKLQHPEACLFVPDGAVGDEALSRTTHLAVGAHQDDIEFMAAHGALTCYRRPGLWFGGVTCTNGSGSPRAGVYADCTDAEMMRLRREEQNLAARIGRYAFMAQLAYSSAAVKQAEPGGLDADLDRLFRAARPRVVYTHNLADKHDTHVAVCLAVLRTLRALPPERRPETVLGCEVWRGLDWMPDAEKVRLDTGGRDHLVAALMGVYDSQIAGGKRYDSATFGRRRANATYDESHGVDTAEQVSYAMDLTPLVRDPAADPAAFAAAAVRRFEDDVRARIARVTPPVPARR